MEESDHKNDSNAETPPDTKSKIKTITHECKICGAPASHSNYGAITCYPCKIFFKRNATKEFTCDFNDQCEINISNRHICTACRLAKCFANGMQVELIRRPISDKNVSNKNQNTNIKSLTATSNILQTTTESVPIELLPTTNLLQPDNLTLTKNQSILLSNLIYSYDETKLLSIAQQIINKYDNVQPTEEIDLNYLKEFCANIYEIAGTYIRSNSDFRTLSSDDRLTFLRNSAENVVCLGAVFIWKQSQIYNCKRFIDTFINIYGEDLALIIERILKYIDSDIVIAKLALSLFAFSNNNSIFSLNRKIQPLNTLPIFQRQNLYAEVLWKYLLLKYDYYDSIRRFSKLIQCLLLTTNTVSYVQNIVKHVNDIESLVEQIELVFILDDIEHIDENKN